MQNFEDGSVHNQRNAYMKKMMTEERKNFSRIIFALHERFIAIELHWLVSEDTYHTGADRIIISKTRFILMTDLFNIPI